MIDLFLFFNLPGLRGQYRLMSSPEAIDRENYR
jgi:hypothetical protein